MLNRILRSETAAAIVLLSSAVLAMLVANSPLSDLYDDVLHAHVLGLSISHWINDALMALFFLLVGMEIKLEMGSGGLMTWKSRALPGIAAVGGMIAPALIFVAINARQPEHLSGWAIPAATDIAFAIGVLAILGSRVPSAIRLLVVGIAIIDDLLAILVIAFFYTADLDFRWLGLAAVLTVSLAVLNKRHVYGLLPYAAIGVGLWVSLYASGIHATLAGVILAFAIPAQSMHDIQRSPMKTTEHAIDRWVSFLILPLFGFANAGIVFSGLQRSDVVGSLPVGIALGLFLGKQLGIFGAIWLAVRFRVASLPPAVGWRQVHAMAMVCGIGFTMSLFIGNLAFGDSPELMNATRIGVVAGSVLSGVVGAVMLLRTNQRPVTVDTATDVAPVRKA